MTIDLTEGLCESEHGTKAFKFHGGEVHFKIEDKDYYRDHILQSTEINIATRIHNSDELMLLILVVDMLRKDGFRNPIRVLLPYFPYMQADRDFAEGETFSLKTIGHLLSTLDVQSWSVFDAHSDSTQMTLKNIRVTSPAELIGQILNEDNPNIDNLGIMSPDNGAYKRVKKIIDRIKWEGPFYTANKDRNISSNNIEDINFNVDDFGGRDLLIIDDICIGGRTFIELAKKLREKNVGKLYLYVSHGIFAYGLDPILEYYDGIYTTNSRKEAESFPKNERYDYFNVFDFLE